MLYSVLVEALYLLTVPSKVNTKPLRDPAYNGFLKEGFFFKSSFLNWSVALKTKN